MRVLDEFFCSIFSGCVVGEWDDCGLEIENILWLLGGGRQMESSQHNFQ